MSTEAAKPPPQANVSIESVLGVQQHNVWQRIIGAQSFWVTVALIIICIVMSYLQPASFATTRELLQHHPQFLVHRHHGARHDRGDRDRRHRPFGRLDHGADGGRERARARGRLSGVGSRCWSAWRPVASRGSSTASSSPTLGISPFVTTLGMLSIARSCAVVLSGNRMIYKFGPGGPGFKSLGSGTLNITPTFQLSYPLLFLIVLTALLAIVYKMTSWGRHVLAIGGNEHAALLTGVPVNRIKVQVYVVSGLAASFAAILLSAGRARRSTRSA